MNLPTELWKDEILSNGELARVYMSLVAMSHNGVIDTSFRQLTLDLRLTLRSVRTMLCKLKKAQLVTQVSTQHSTQIIICQSESKHKRPTQSKSQETPQIKTQENILLFPEAEPTFESKYPFVDSMMIPAFKEWLEYKKERKEAYKTERTAKAAYKKLMELSKGNPQVAMAIVEQSEAHQWASMYELKTNYYVNGTNNPANQPSGRGQHRNPDAFDIAKEILGESAYRADYR